MTNTEKVARALAFASHVRGETEREGRIYAQAVAAVLYAEGLLGAGFSPDWFGDCYSDAYRDGTLAERGTRSRLRLPIPT